MNLERAGCRVTWWAELGLVLPRKLHLWFEPWDPAKDSGGKSGLGGRGDVPVTSSRATEVPLYMISGHSLYFWPQDSLLNFSWLYSCCLGSGAVRVLPGSKLMVLPSVLWEPLTSCAALLHFLTSVLPQIQTSSFPQNLNNYCFSGSGFVFANLVNEFS